MIDHSQDIAYVPRSKYKEGTFTGGHPMVGNKIEARSLWGGI